LLADVDFVEQAHEMIQADAHADRASRLALAQALARERNDPVSGHAADDGVPMSRPLLRPSGPACMRAIAAAGSMPGRPVAGWLGQRCRMRPWSSMTSRLSSSGKSLLWRVSRSCSRRCFSLQAAVALQLGDFLDQQVGRAKAQVDLGRQARGDVEGGGFPFEGRFLLVRLPLSSA
jgi:hypothetical protein